MIEVEGLEFVYPGRTQPAIRSISFSASPGEIFGFLGPSGAGKSTTQRILMRLLRKYKGSARVFARELASWGSDYYERVGISFELPNHYLKLTALENLHLFGSLYTREVIEPLTLLKSVGLEADANTRVGTFSKGMQMRLNFARAIQHQPDLLFLDEPTAGLDPGNARLIKEKILALKQAGRTIFLTTHDMTIADELCDRVAFIVDGAVSLIDSPRALKLQHGKRLVRIEYRNGTEMGIAEFPMPGLAENTEFLGLLRDERIETMHSEEATLEQIFLDVTGRSLA